MPVTDPTWLNVNGVDLATPAWRITDLSELLNEGPVRGGDLVMPLAEGVRPYRRRRTVRTVTLPMDIYGDFDQDGGVVADPVQGVISHMIFLAQNLGIGDDATAEDGTVDAIWTLPDDSQLFAPGHVIGLLGTVSVAPGLLRTTLDLSFPEGGFFEVVNS